MPGELQQYLSDDHDRLDALLERAVANPEQIDLESFSEFRKGLLRHISTEEKIVRHDPELLEATRQLNLNAKVLPQNAMLLQIACAYYISYRYRYTILFIVRQDQVPY
jgi:hypothetical protein